MATKKERAEVKEMLSKIEEKKKSLAEFEKIDSEEARYRAEMLKTAIKKLQQKCSLRMVELLRKK